MEKETINYKNKEIQIFYDEDAISPDDWGNDDVFLVYDHRSFFFKRKGFDPEEIYDIMGVKKLFDGYYYFPVFAYIHSGVSLSLKRFNDPWDTSFRGFVLVKRGKGTWTQAKAEVLAEGLINEWNDYLSGNVYGYTSNYGDCSGYFGEDGYEQMIKEAKQEIDCHIDEEIKKHFQQLKEMIINKVPFQYRPTFNLINS